MDDIWIPLGESLLIEMFVPLWNRILDGFGIHDLGGDVTIKRPCRGIFCIRGELGAQTQPGRKAEEIMRAVEAHLRPE